VPGRFPRMFPRGRPESRVAGQLADRAPIALGMFRAENVSVAGGSGIWRLVETLMARNPEFRHFWQRSCYTAARVDSPMIVAERAARFFFQ
jgi:hypothetical protein